MPARRDYYESTMPESKEATCRTCTDFKSWSKVKKTTSSADLFIEEINKVGLKMLPPDCPLDRGELGRYTWSFLHTMAASYPATPSAQDQRDMKNFFTIFSKLYPCDSCAEHFRKQLSVSPPLVKSQNELKEWLCWVHNNVNRRLGKTEFDCKLIDERWKDGRADGSCNV